MSDYDAEVKRTICEVVGAEDDCSWERIDAAVDSAAIDSVIPVPMLPHIKLQPSRRSLAGKQYISANDKEIKNHGEKKVAFQTMEKLNKAIMFQMADVSRVLISVDKLNAAGSDVHLRKKGAYIITPQKERIGLKRKNGAYILTMWIKIPKGEGQKKVHFGGKEAETLAMVNNGGFARQEP